MNMKQTIIAAALVTITGCANNPNSIQSSYVSPVKYADYSCQQLSMEQDNIRRRVDANYAQLKSENTKDKWVMAAGMLVFWPALFLLDGDDEVTEAEYARMKGEYDALESAVVLKKCGMDTNTAS